MNKTEAEYADVILAARIAAGDVVCWWFEAIGLKLGEDCRYHPDFLVLTASGELEVHEVKGTFVRDDAFVKLKTAASRYPLRFIMAQRQAKKHGGGWKLIEIPSDTWSAREAA